MAFNKTQPAEGIKAKDMNDLCRTNFEGLENIISQDHDMSTGGTQTGKHKKVTLQELADDPTVAANEFALYIKEVSGKAELFFKNEDGDVVQLISGTKIRNELLDLLDEDDMASDSASQAASQQSVKAYVDALSAVVGRNAPVGMMAPYAGSAAPTGWLLCNAAAVSRTTYAGLFAVIGTTYGVGDGSTTFNLPDLRGRVPMGAGTGDATDATAHALASKAGTEGVTLTAAQSGLPAHTHTTNLATASDSGQTANFGGGTASVQGTKATGANTSAAASAAHNNVQPSLTVNYIIKA